MDVTDLNETQMKCLNQLKDDLGDSLVPSHADRYLIKWLKARNFNVSKAKNMYKKSMEWRRRVGADELLNWKPPEALVKYYAGGQCGVDKEGHPVFFDLIGHQDLHGLLHSCKTSDILKYEALSLEEAVQAQRAQTKILGRTIDQLTVIMDTSSIGIKHLKKTYIRIFNDIMQITEANYPENLKRCLIINAPRIFPMLFTLVKPFLSEDTKQKIIMLGSNWKEKILEYVDADQIPVHWGGTKTDPDGDEYCRSKICIGGKIPESFYRNTTTDADSILVPVTVLRRQYHTVGVDVKSVGTIIRWQFRTQAHDIGFGVFINESEDPKNINLQALKEIEPIEKVNSHLVLQDGAISCEQTGTYILVFDNRYSMLNAKALECNVELLDPKEEDETSNDHSSLASDDIKL